MEKKAGITAPLAIVEHNTSEESSLVNLNVSSPKETWLEKYGTHGDPTELAMLKTLVESQGVETLRRLKKYQITSNTQSPIANGVLLIPIIYYSIGGIPLLTKGVYANFMYLKDYVKEFDYYYHQLSSQTTTMKDKKEKKHAKFQAIKKGATNMP